MASSSSPRWKCHIISLDEIEEATDNFNQRNFLGHGGEGDVYVAEIRLDSKRTRVALKHLNPNNSTEYFEEEIKTVSKIQHPNLVSLLGYCNESGKKILLYEFMEKGSLSSYVKKGSSICLSWQQRLRICLDVARGLQHLHVETDEFPFGIIHRDVKPDNILLDKNWVAKISDFGMLKPSYIGQIKSVIITDLKGTGGYIAPELFTHHSINRKIDVYAFGVVLFQVLCLKMPWDRGLESYYRTKDEDLGIWAQQNVDARIREEICDNSLKTFTAIVEKSLEMDPIKRPTMDRVVLDLEHALECQKHEDETKQLGAARGSDEQSTGFRPREKNLGQENALYRQKPEAVRVQTSINGGLVPRLPEPAPNMDTREKSTTEFRNYVYETLARHDSNFDQLHASMLTILNELQFLRTNRQIDINPLAHDEQGKVKYPSYQESTTDAMARQSRIKHTGIMTFIRKLRWWPFGKARMTSEELKAELPGKNFNFQQIKNATKNFSIDNKVGEGGFGSVYKGLLPDGTEIAVRRFLGKSRQGIHEFVNEVGIVSALRHPNLVKLLGSCAGDGERLLIYEYMENNSLKHALFGSQELKRRLNWATRVQICCGIAKGLAFLHEESELKVVHRDIKLTNILLDKDLTAKISGFGLSKLYENIEDDHISTRIAGTMGYMAPEYAMRGHLTYKADVYSFGVVLLEIVSGKNSASYLPNDQSVYLLDLAYILQKEGKLIELVDTALEGNYSLDEANTILNLALLCTDRSYTLRPNMSKVVKILEGEIKMDNYTIGERYLMDDSAMSSFQSTPSHAGISDNNLTCPATNEIEESTVSTGNASYVVNGNGGLLGGKES